MQLKPGAFCPLIKKECVQMQCSWFMQLRGTHRQTGKEVDDGGGSVAWLATLLIETAKESRHTGAAVESFRNEMVKANDSNTRVLQEVIEREQQAHRIANIIRDDPKLIEAV
jgi:hypothetical protein